MMIKNYNRPYGHYREYIELYLGFDTEPSHAIRVLTAAAKSVAIGISGTKSDVVIMGITEQGIKYRVRYWTPEFLKQHLTRTELVTAIMSHLYRAGITPIYQPNDIFITDMKDKEVHNIKGILSRNSFFKVFNDEELNLLSKVSTKVMKPINSIIVEEKELKNSLFIIIEGFVKVTVRDKEGEEKSITTMEAGDIFGEYSLLTGEKHFATMKAITELLVYEIKDKDIKPILKNRPSIIKDLSESLAERRGKKKYFMHIPKNKESPILEEKVLSKKIFEDINDFFSSIFS